MAYHLIDDHETCPVIILTESDAEAWLDRKFPPSKYCQDIPMPKFQTAEDKKTAARKKKWYQEEASRSEAWRT